MKKKYGMSNFWKNVIWMFILLFIIWLLWFSPMFKDVTLDNYNIGGMIFFLKIITFFCIFVYFIILHMKLDISLNYKYRIIEKDGWFDTKTYKPEVLKSWWWFLIWWQPVSTTCTTYKSQNIFGADTVSGYSTDDTFKSIEESTEAINKYKKKAKEQIKKFFQKREKEKKLIIKV